MEVLPRLSKVPAPQQIIIEPEAPAKEEPKVEPPNENKFSSWLTIAFVAVIIILAGLIIYLVSRNEKYMGWIRGAPKQTVPVVKEQPKLSNQTAEIVDTVSNDELLKFQAMLSNDKPAPAPAPVPNKEVVINESANTVKTIEEIDAKTKENLVSQIDQNVTEQQKTIIDENIIEAMNKDVEELEKSNDSFIPIEQFSTKQNTIVKTYYSKQEILDMSYDYDEIIKCCKEEIPRYKGYKWSFKNTLKEN